MVKKKKKDLTQEEENQIKLEKLKKVYDEISDEYNLEGKDIIEQIHILVDVADDLMCEICSTSDDIKINDFEKVKEFTSIDKKTYLDFVNICALKNNDALKEKAISKFEEDFAQRLLITNLRHSFLESYMNGDELKITDEDNEEYKPFTDYKSDDFEQVMQDSAKKREYLNLVLWKKYKRIAKAAEYITKLELTYKDFKNLVDWQHYRDGGYPSPTSPSKIWAIFDRFNYAHRTLTKWGYENTANELKKEFGLNISENIPNPMKHPWMENKEKEID